MTLTRTFKSELSNLDYTIFLKAWSFFKEDNQQHIPSTKKDVILCACYMCQPVERCPPQQNATKFHPQGPQKARKRISILTQDQCFFNSQKLSEHQNLVDI